MTMPHETHEIDHHRGGDARWSAAVFAVAASILVWLSAPGVLWYDTGEFGAVAWRLSLSHPPGHPLHALVTHGMEALWPFGDLGFRANLTSAICLALALAFLYRLLRFLGPGLRPWCAALLSLLPLMIPAVAEQGIRAEVYALQILLSVLLAIGCARTARGEDRRMLPLLAFTFGLAGANHSYIGALLIPVALLAMWAASSKLKEIFLAGLAGMAGLATYIYLPLRARAGLDVGWGQPDSAVAFWQTISGKEWASNLIPDSNVDGLLSNLQLVFNYVTGQIGFWMFGGILLLWLFAAPSWIRERRGQVFVVVLTMALPFILRLGNDFDPQNPDMGGYLAVGFLGVVVLTAEACHGLSVAKAGTAVLILVVAGLGQWAGGPSNTARQDRAAERYVVGLLDEVPVDGVLITGDYSSTFTSWWLRSLMGVRPDATLVFRGQIYRPWHRSRVDRFRPGMARRLDGYPDTFMTTDVAWELGVRMDRLGIARNALRPTGLTAGLRRQWPTVMEHSKLFSAFDGASFAGRRFRALLHAHFAGQLMAARAPIVLVNWHIDMLRALAGGDPMVLEFEQRARRYDDGSKK